MRSKKLQLQNVTKKKKVMYDLSIDYEYIKILDWSTIIQIIRLHEPTSDLNKILIQIRICGIWQYLTSSFSHNIEFDSREVIQIRYKIYDQLVILQKQKQAVEKLIKSCESQFEKYKDIFDYNSIDINLFWASPLFKAGGSLAQKQWNNNNNLVEWSIGCQGYIKEIGETIKSKNKKAYLNTNLFNLNSFNGKGQEYSIVYILCHTEPVQKKQKQKNQKNKYYFIGENPNSQLIPIFPEQISEMIKQKRIQLLILHSSYHCDHLPFFKNCKNIQNILLIKSNPIYRSKSTSLYLKSLFQNLLQKKQLQQAHIKSLQQVRLHFQDDEMCCCYHQCHEQKCQFSLNSKANKFYTYHYREHYLKKVVGACCCTPVQKMSIQEHKERHNLSQKFYIAKQSAHKTFQFQKGQLKGDVPYLKGFQTRQRLIGNRVILGELLKTFYKEQGVKKQNTFKIFNLYNRMCGDKKMFVDSLANFLIRRKIFTSNIILNLKQIDWQQKKEPSILYTIFCDSINVDMIKKFKNLKMNLLLVSLKQLDKNNISEQDDKQISNIYVQAPIRNLNYEECMNYLKAQRHLSLDMKIKIRKFFGYVWKGEYKSIYYPSNFDYLGLMSIIAQSNYQKQDEPAALKLNHQFFDRLIEYIIKKNKLKNYLLVMSVYSCSSQERRVHLATSIQKIDFVSEAITETIKEIKKLNKYANMHIQNQEMWLKKFQQFCNKEQIVYQKYFHLIQKFVIQMMVVYCKLTLCQDNDQKQGIQMYEATTKSINSQISMFFKQSIQNCISFQIEDKETDLFFQECHKSVVLKAALKLAKRITTCFYLYNSLQQKQSQQKQKYRYSVIENMEQQKRQNKEDNQWQKKLEKDKKSKILIMCLIAINNAIIFGRSAKNLKQCGIEYRQNNSEIKIMFQEMADHKIKRQFLNKQEHQGNQDGESDDETITEQETIQLRRNYSQIKENSFYQYHNDRVYEQKEFLIEIESLSRNGLLYVLSKIRSKKPNYKILSVCDSLIIQIFLEEGYLNHSFKQNYFIQSINNVLSQMEFLIKAWSQSYTSWKFRIAYDILVCKFLLKTKCGRQKITEKKFYEIDSQFKIVFDPQPKQVQINSAFEIFSLDFLQLIQQMCETKQVYLRMRQNLRLCCCLRKKKYAQERIMKGFKDIVKLWHKFNKARSDIYQKVNVNASYYSLFSLQKQLQSQKFQKDKNFHSMVYIEDLARNLQNQVLKLLRQLRDKILIILSTNSIESLPLKRTQNQNHYLINFEQLFEKCYANNYRSYNNISDQDSESLLVVKLELNLQNLRILLKTIGCKYLLINTKSEYEFISGLNANPNAIENNPQANSRQAISLIFSDHQNSLIFLVLQKNLDSSSSIFFNVKFQKLNEFKPQNYIKKFDPSENTMMAIIICIKIASLVFKLPKNQQSARNFVIQNRDSIMKTVITNLQIIYKYNTEEMRKVQEQTLRVIADSIYINYSKDKLPIANNEPEYWPCDQEFPIQLQKSELVRPKHLKEILDLFKIKQYTRQNPGISKTIKDINNLTLFFNNFKFFMKQKYSIQNFFEFEYEQEQKVNKNSRNKFKDYLTDQKFLIAINSKQSMVVIIKNFQLKQDNTYLKYIINTLFNKDENKQFKNWFVKISNVQCLICIKYHPEQRV